MNNGQHTSSPANWQDAFGPEAEVCFHAWAVATYVGKVAAAGKAVYALPLYVNAALRDPFKGRTRQLRERRTHRQRAFYLEGRGAGDRHSHAGYLPD